MTGFLIAGTASGVGKTTVTLAVTAALRRRGYVVQPFKGGPDFLDTGHHGRIASRKSRNLDTWMLSHQANREVLRAAARGADVLIAEGMMGLFDGKSGKDETGSSAEIAKLLELPVVLVVDAGKSARSVAAIVLGFELFDTELPLAGVILNRVASERHFQMIEAAITQRCATPVLGWLPREPSLHIPERHLGLQSAEELSPELGEGRFEAMADAAEKHLALDRLLTLQCGSTSNPEADSNIKIEARLRIGIAHDVAFTFYYEDNFDLLRKEGAELVPFSPISDGELPPMLDALYLGGGYPEIFASALSTNHSMLAAVRDFAASGRPVYAECGGMMYLAAVLRTKDGDTYEMAGVFPFHIEMTSHLVRFGYVTVEFTRDCLMGPPGTIIRGHSFHYSNMSGMEDALTNYQVTYSLSGKAEYEGFGLRNANVLASYIHLNFRANPAVAKSFVDAAIAARIRDTVQA